MIAQNSNILEKDLQQTANMLLLNGTLTECPGLIHGKMGITIFFFHYAKHAKNQLFTDYALDIIGEMQRQLHANYRADYEKGIAGIGVGIDYLIQNNFFNVEKDFFEDFDERVYRAVMYEPYSNFGIYDGLTGYGRYWIIRLRREPSSIHAKDCLKRIIERIEGNLQNISLKEQNDVYCFLNDLYEFSDLCIPIELFEQLRKQAIDTYLHSFRLKDLGMERIFRLHLFDHYFNEFLPDEMHKTLKQIPNLVKENIRTSMGLLTGYAGKGLLQLTALNAIDSSWIRLL